MKQAGELRSLIRAADLEGLPLGGIRLQDPGEGREVGTLTGGQQCRYGGSGHAEALGDLPMGPTGLFEQIQ